jgi:hypothetical protein
MTAARLSVVLAMLLWRPTAGALTPLATKGMCPATTTVLSALTAHDEDVLLQTIATGDGVLYFFNAPPPAADVSGFHVTGDGDLRVAFDTTYRRSKT